MEYWIIIGNGGCYTDYYDVTIVCLNRIKAIEQANLLKEDKGMYDNIVIYEAYDHDGVVNIKENGKKIVIL